MVLQGIDLESLKTSMVLSLNKGTLAIDEAKLKRGRSQYLVTGDINFENKTYLKLDGKVISSSYLQLKKLIDPITKDIDFLPDDASGIIEGGVEIVGFIDDLKVSGGFSARDVGLWSENIERLSSRFSYRRNNLKLEDVILKKGRGIARGRYVFNGISKSHYYDINVKGIRLYDFSNINQSQFSFDSDMNIEAKGSFKDASIDNKIAIKFENSTIAKRRCLGFICRYSSQRWYF